MFKIAGLVFGLSVLPTIAVAQQPTELMIGWLSYSSGTISQDLSVQNNSYLPIKTVTIRCRFFHDLMRKQIGAGAVKIENIASNAIGYKTMIITSHTKPISTTCHIVSVTHPQVAY